MGGAEGAFPSASGREEGREGGGGDGSSPVLKGLSSNNTGIGMVPLHGYNILQTGILEMRVIDSNVVYFVLVPILLYEATQSINWHKFKRFLAGGLVLAVLGVRRTWRFSTQGRKTRLSSSLLSSLSY